tara:strand:- start:532 stop:1128 length:597 start_codon:yes stop_codon:yes gene_type:complete
MADKKFVNLHESYMRRYERGGFLVGDVFEFNDDYESTECYKALPKATKDLLTKMKDSGLHIRVVGIKDTAPTRYPASSQQSSLNVNLNLALDEGGGRYSHYVTVPGTMGHAVQYAPNLLPIPDTLYRKSNVNIKPEEYVEDEEMISNRSDRGGTEPHELSPTERSLPKQNTTIPSDPATPSPAVTSYTNQYLSDLKKA